MIHLRKLSLTAFLCLSHAALLAADYTWTGAASSDWLTPANWSPAGPPGSADTANIASGSPAINSGVDVLCGTVNLSGSASLNAGTGLKVNNAFNFSGGALSGKLTVAGGATMVISNSGSSVNLGAGPVVNFGTVICHTAVLMPAGAVLTNNGTWTIEAGSFGASGAARFYNAASGVFNVTANATFNNLLFDNAGVLSVSGAGLTLPFGAALDGSINVSAGQLVVSGGAYLNGAFTTAADGGVQFSGGTFTNNKASFTGAGKARLTGGTIYLTNDVSPNLQLGGGTVALGPQFQNNGAIASLTLSGATLVGTNIVTGTLNWVAGSINDFLTVQNNGVLNVSGSGDVYLRGSITNSGQILWNGPCHWHMVDGASINNLSAGLFDIQFDQILDGPITTPFYNSGLVQKSLGLGTAAISIPFHSSGGVSVLSGILDFRGGGDFGGTLTTANGATITLSGGGALLGTFNAGYGGSIALSGGTFTLGPSVKFGGAGICQQTGGVLTLLDTPVSNLLLAGGTVNLPPTFQGGAIANLSLTNGQTLGGSNYVTGVFNFSGVLAGPVTIASGGVLNWYGGALQGALNVAAGGVVNIIGLSGNTLEFQNDVTNNGTINWTGSYLTLRFNHDIYNQAGSVFNIQCDFTFNNNYGSEVFYNLGLLRKFGSPGTNYFYPGLNNNGIVQVDSGGLVFTGVGPQPALAGQFNAAPGTKLLFSVGGDLAGAFNAAAGATIDLHGGNFSLTSAATFAGAGTNIMTGGTMTLTTNNVPGLQIAGGNFTLAPQFQGGAITNLVLNGNLGGSNYVEGALTLNGSITGVISLAPHATFTWSGGYINGPLTVPATATVNLVGPQQMTFYAGVTNSGTINWSGGDIYLQGSLNFNNLQGGTFNINCDEYIYNYYYYNAVFNNAGVIHKFGTGDTTIFYTGLNNLGRVDVDSGELELDLTYTGDQFNNFGGLFHTAPGGAITFDGGGQFSGVFSNELGGVIDLHSGAFTNLPGVVYAGAGSNVLSGGTMTLDTDVIPNLAINGLATVTLGPNFQGGSITNLTVGAYIANSNTVSGVLTMTGGGFEDKMTVLPGAVINLSAPANSYFTAADDFTLPSNATMNVTGPGYVYFQASLTNLGAIHWTGGPMYIGNGVFENLGLFSIECDSSFSSYYYYSYQGALKNDGTIVKRNTSGETLIYSGFSNAGTVDLQSGSLLLDNYSAVAGTFLGGSFTLANGAALNLESGGLLSGRFDVAPGGTLVLSSGNFTNTASTQFTGAGDHRFTGGTFYLTTNVSNLALTGGSVIPSGGFDLGSLASLTLNGSSLAGTNTVNGTLNLNGDLEGPLTVHGTLNFRGSIYTYPLILTPGATLNWSNGTTYVPLTIPAGATLNLVGDYVQAGAPVTNFGVVNWRSGQLQLYYGDIFYNQTGGVFNVLCDNVFYGSGPAAFVNKGLFRKTSSQYVNNFQLPFLNSGAIDLESGGVAFLNPFTDDNGTWIFGINSLTSFGHASFSQPLALTGALGAHFNQGFQVSSNNAFPLLAFTSQTGAFSGFAVTPGEDAQYQLIYGPTNIVLLTTNRAAPVVSITAPANRAVVAGPATINLTASAPGADTVLFYANGGFIGSDSAAPFNFAWPSVAPGAYFLSAIASNAQGSVVTSSPPVAILVTPPNSHGQTYAWTGASSSEWSDAGNWSPAGVPAANDSALINQSGNIHVAAAVAVNDLVLGAGNLQGPGAITVASNMVWAGGGLNGVVTVGPAGKLTIASSSSLDLAGGALINYGRASWVSGDLQGDGNSVVANHGTWVALGNNAFNGGGLFTNSGSFYKTNGAGTTLINSVFDTTGTVETDSGVLRLGNGGDLAGPFQTMGGALLALSAGYFTSDTNCAFGGAGTNVLGDQGYAPIYGVLDISTNLQLLYGSQITLSPFFQDHGRITNLTYQGTLVGSNTVTGVLTCTAGYIEDSMTVAPGGVLNLAGSNYDITLSGAFTVYGQVRWTAGIFTAPRRSPTPGFGSRSATAASAAPPFLSIMAYSGKRRTSISPASIRFSSTRG